MSQFIIPVLVLIIIVFIVIPKIKEFRAVSGVIDKARNASIWGKLCASLSGLKTVICGSLAAVFPQLPEILDEAKAYTGWNVFLSQVTADKIAAFLAGATILTHMYGLVSAAKIMPVDQAAPKG